MEFQKPVRVIAFADLDKLGWQLDKNQRTRRLGVLLVTASELTGDPFWLCVCLDESALAYRRKTWCVHAVCANAELADSVLWSRGLRCATFVQA